MLLMHADLVAVVRWALFAFARHLLFFSSFLQDQFPCGVRRTPNHSAFQDGEDVS